MSTVATRVYAPRARALERATTSANISLVVRIVPGSTARRSTSGLNAAQHGSDRTVGPVGEPVRVRDASHVARGEEPARFRIERHRASATSSSLGAEAVGARGGRFHRRRSRARRGVVVGVPASSSRVVVGVGVVAVLASGDVDGIIPARSSARAGTHASTRDVPRATSRAPTVRTGTPRASARDAVPDLESSRTPRAVRGARPGRSVRAVAIVSRR